jgi:hypothetical protein
VKHILGIPTSKIKTKNIFSIARILISLYRCHFQINNIEKIIFATKNWPIDSHVGYLKHLDLVSSCEAKSILTYELEVEFEDGMECEEFPKLGDMIYLPHY